jgi:putative glutamine amidotransferase
MRPVIGLTQCLDDRGRWRSGRDYLYLDAAYVRCLEGAGASVLLLPMQREIDSLVDRIDGLLIPGGNDFAPPEPYPDEVAFDLAPESQIDFDRRLLEAVLARGLPMLGICYGHQLLALHHGGSLHHHLPHDLPGSDPHQLPERGGQHVVTPLPGTRMARLYGDAPFDVNSLHHQAVADPGDGLRVSATAPDGVVEAVEAPGDHFAVGVQWHPEKLSGSAGAPLFRALVEACAEG